MSSRYLDFCLDFLDWLNITDEKGNIENIDWKLAKLETGFNRVQKVFILRNNPNEKEIKEAKVKEFNSWKQNDVYEEEEYKNQKLISTRWKDERWRN